MQFQKKIWNESVNMKKNDMITYLLQCSTVLNEDIQKWSKQTHILMVE